MNYTIPQSWKDLNEYQLENISKLLFSNDEKDFSFAVKLLRAVSVPNNSWWQTIKFHFLCLNVPVTELLPYINFINTEPEVYHFPDIPGLKKPTHKIGSFSIKQFSVADYFFYHWQKTKKEIYLRQLVGSLYTTASGFSEDNLYRVANITDRLTPGQRLRIAFAYMCSRNYIVKAYPIVFPPPKEIDKEVMVPVFHNKDSGYIPFNDVIIAMAFDENQPLGNYHSAKETNVYDFMKIFSKSIERQEELKKQLEKK